MQANTGGLRRFQNGGRKTDCTRLNWNLQNLLVVDIGTFLDITVYWQNKVKYSDLKRHQPSLYDKHGTYYNSENYVTFDFCSKTVLIMFQDCVMIVSKLIGQMDPKNNLSGLLGKQFVWMWIWRDLHSNEHHWSSSENKAWKKIQAWIGFEPMISGIPVQCSTNWANKPTGSWSACWFQINVWSGEKMTGNIWKSYIFTSFIWKSYIWTIYGKRREYESDLRSDEH